MKIHRKHINHLKHLGLILFIGFVSFIFLLVGANIYFDKIYPKASSIILGISFSEQYAQELGLDWKQTYVKILDDLNVKKLRLNTYWQYVEPRPGEFNFHNLDYMLKLAESHQAKVLLVIGEKQPRWPECYIPDWAKSLSVQDRQKKVLNLISKVVQKYKSNTTIEAWQVENEPIFNYGANCDPVNRKFLKEKVDLVRLLDPTRKIVVTDSGELRFWRTPMMLSDVFGTTLYRTVHNPIFGYFHWPLPPAAYRLKSNLAREIFAPKNEKTIIVELQTEPWIPGTLMSTSVDQQVVIFPIKDFVGNVAYARKTGFDEVYLWGVEWWYSVGNHGHPEYLQLAKEIFLNN